LPQSDTLAPPGQGSPRTYATDWQHHSLRPASCTGRTSSCARCPSRGSTPSGTRCRGGPPTVSCQPPSASLQSSLPPMPLLVSQRQRLAALRTVCSAPDVNPATAPLHPSLPSLSSYRAPDRSRARTKGLSSVYLPLRKTPRPSPPLRNHLPIDAVAHRTIAFTAGLSCMPMINAHLVPEVLPNLPPQSLMESTYSDLKKRVREALIEDWSRLFPAPAHYHDPPALYPRPIMGLGKFIVGQIDQMRAGKS